MKKKLIAVLGVFLLLLLVMTPVIIEQAENTEKAADYKTLGSQHQELLKQENAEREDKQKVASVNGKVIYQYSVEAAVLSHQMAGNDFTDQEVLERLIRYQVLVQKAEQEGIIVPEAKIELEIEAIRDAYQEDTQFLEFIKPYLAGVGMSFEEYLKYSEAALLDSLRINEMKKEKTKGMQAPEATKYWEEFVEKCINQADIEIYKNN